jgi:hypothetical protein
VQAFDVTSSDAARHETRRIPSMTRHHLDPETFRQAGAACGDRFRLLSTPDPDPEQAAEINRIAATMAERNAAVRQELATLGRSARDATWAVRRLLAEMEPT